MIESTEATSAGLAAGVTNGAAVMGLGVGDGAAIGFSFSCAATTLATRIMTVKDVTAVDMSFMSISFNEFFLSCKLQSLKIAPKCTQIKSALTVVAVPKSICH